MHHSIRAESSKVEEEIKPKIEDKLHKNDSKGYVFHGNSEKSEPGKL